jgi:epoxyqueuosine reductase
MAIDREQITRQIRKAAEDLGFSPVGVCSAVEPPHFSFFVEWLDKGFHGEMEYLERRRQAYAHPRSVLEGVRTIVMLGFPYRTVEPSPGAVGKGRISRYAWGQDYHHLIRRKLKSLEQTVKELCPGSEARGVVDTAPLLEREFAQLAGLGWIGKNTLLINPRLGSWLFLAALLTTADLVVDRPFEANHCGTCTACLRACPTGALVAPYVLDARRCLSYLTIELRGPIPQEWRSSVDHWFFGCDICQEVCPWNRRAPASGEPSLMPRWGTHIELIELFEWSDEQFRAAFRDMPLWRAKRRGLLRNAAIVLGNQRCTGAVAALTRGLGDSDAVVREACGWALVEIGTQDAVLAVRARIEREPDPWVRDQLIRHLEGAVPSIVCRDGPEEA